MTRKPKNSGTQTDPEPIPEWVALEIRETWNAAKDAGGQTQAYRILENMVDRLGYGRLAVSSLVPVRDSLERLEIVFYRREGQGLNEQPRCCRITDTATGLSAVSEEDVSSFQNEKRARIALAAMCTEQL